MVMIKRVTQADYDKYTAFLEENEHSHFMQSAQWGEFKKKQKSFMIMSLDDSENVRGVMLLFLQEVRHTKKKYLYAPRGPICNRNNTEVLAELLEEAEKIAKENKAYKLTLDPDITTSDEVWLEYFETIGARIGENRCDNGILQPLSVFRIDVNKTDDELMTSYHSKARYSVRSSIKSGAVCRVGGREDIPVFCELLANTAKKDGFTARGCEYFYDMYDAMGKECFKVFVVEYEGTPIAASVLLKFGKKTWHMYAGSSDEYKETSPNFLMQWEMQRWSRDNGAFLYDMRGIAGEGDKLTPIEGLVRFKKRFGGELCSFVGRIDIVYNKLDELYVRIMRKLAAFVRRMRGRK